MKNQKTDSGTDSGKKLTDEDSEKQLINNITDEFAEKTAMLIYQYDFPKDRDIPVQLLRVKALDRYANNPLTNRVVRDLVSLNLQMLIQIEVEMIRRQA